VRVAVALILATAVAGLAACGSSEHASTSKTAAASAAVSAKTAPAGVRTGSGHVFPGEGAQPQSHAGSRRVAAPAVASSSGTTGTHAAATPAASGARLGRYVGPAHNGANRCGYVAIGPGLEQASAFVVHGVSCATARALAAAKRNQRPGNLAYSALGFACKVQAKSATKLQQFDCTDGAAAVSFVVA
jgi:hypothetical protein